MAIRLKVEFSALNIQITKQEFASLQASSDATTLLEFVNLKTGLDFVNKLKPKSFWFRKNRKSDEKHGQQRYGFIAQDILALEGDNPIIIDNEQEDHLKYKGEHLIPILVKAIQELTMEVNKLKSNG